MVFIASPTLYLLLSLVIFSLLPPNYFITIVSVLVLHAKKTVHDTLFDYWGVSNFIIVEGFLHSFSVGRIN